MTNSNNLYKTLFFVLLIGLLAVGAFLLGNWYQQKNTNNDVPKNSVTEIVKPTVLPTVLPTNELSDEQRQKQEAKEAIVNIMAQKFNKQPSEVNINISQYEPSFAQGAVGFEGEMGGGWFLAAEVGGQWVLVDDGNGTISCEKIEPYNFPVSIVSECWSDSSQSLISR